MNKDGYMDIRPGWMRGTSVNETLFITCNVFISTMDCNTYFKKSFLLLTKNKQTKKIKTL